VERPHTSYDKARLLRRRRAAPKTGRGYKDRIFKHSFLCRPGVPASRSALVQGSLRSVRRRPGREVLPHDPCTSYTLHQEVT
jgi:hypothetical protein